ncbi:MAG TPA: winged helix-turn-helix domain-containing protein [Anaerolineales bacterium]|nr:winged helix-turn-helix domain-containing protein [Anaerolineales bacterium]
MTSSKSTPLVTWDCGTAYDLFASLHVLHRPDRFGLRRAWAAGVRSRIPAVHRSVLEESQDLFGTPLAWIYRLPAPKDAATALWALEQLPEPDRLPALALTADVQVDTTERLNNIAQRGSWNDEDLEALRSLFQQRGWVAKPKALVNILNCWSHPGEFGARYLAALQAYQAAFFAEEERRIQPVLEAARQQAQELASQVPFAQLVETLSQGVQIAALHESAQVVLAPSYWSTPLVIYGHLDVASMLMLFGGRPAERGLVPGEVIPDAMLRALKALADPTRLKMLRYLAEEPLTPAQLARRLRLRAPTMIHHLNALRLAGLVHVELEAEGEKRYTSRVEVAKDTFAALQDFLERR